MPPPTPRPGALVALLPVHPIYDLWKCYMRRDVDTLNILRQNRVSML